MAISMTTLVATMPGTSGSIKLRRRQLMARWICRIGMQAGDISRCRDHNRLVTSTSSTEPPEP
ncbi:hypothetical protein CR103_16795 [Massilia psychrophila]|uniref:Uncharacterized protein n=1 Tax=Massilia psychrophila TaxID=1603353 RepID=A0A2G8SY14_9BURK|nr:hypothetical protein CR103_16795 [Massilia psychrophila]